MTRDAQSVRAMKPSVTGWSVLLFALEGAANACASSMDDTRLASAGVTRGAACELEEGSSFHGCDGTEPAHHCGFPLVTDR